MNAQRLKSLEHFFEEDPNDPFNAYALAMEYLNNDLFEAKKYFDILLDRFPSYLATYYQAATLYAEIENNKKAEELYKRGIELAVEQQNIKAFQELQRAYRAFEDERE